VFLYVVSDKKKERKTTALAHTSLVIATTWLHATPGTCGMRAALVKREEEANKGAKGMG
jgi:hypothetical protein